MTEKRFAKLFLGFGVFFALTLAIIHAGHIDTTKRTCSQTTIPGIVHEVNVITPDSRTPLNTVTITRVVSR